MSDIIIIHENKDPWTHVRAQQTVNFGFGPQVLEGFGAAKRSYQDSPIAQVGFEVAKLRAVLDLHEKRAKYKASCKKRREVSVK
jgi:hypothetical protein